jgi:hypothetical protein
LQAILEKLILEFSVKTRVLSTLLKYDAVWQWSQKHTDAFNYVINILASAPVPTIFNPSLPIELHTDASSKGFGAIIIQIHDGLKKVVAYFSKATTPMESRYHSYELETLAVVSALKHFRYYLVGLRFTLVTDCNSVKSSQFKRDLIPRITRWWVYLQDLDFVIEHRAGPSIAYVDYLSRNSPAVCSANVHHILSIADEINEQAISKMPEGWLAIQQSNDSETIEIKKKLLINEIDSKQFCVIGTTLCHAHVSEINSEKVTQYFVPKNAGYALLKEYHDGQCHISIDKTILSLSIHFWFPRM